MTSPLLEIFEFERLHCVYARSATSLYRKKKYISAMGSQFEALFWKDLAAQEYYKFTTEEWMTWSCISGNFPRQI